MGGLHESVLETHPTGREMRVEGYLLERTALARGERQVVDAVTAARTKGLFRPRIGELLGTLSQAAQQRYGAVIETG